MSEELDFELKPFDFVFDHDYFLKEHREVCQAKKETCESWYKSREYFIENLVKTCEAPNKVFAKEEGILGTKEKGNKCRLEEWLKPLKSNKVGILKLLPRYLNSIDDEDKVYKWKIGENNLKEIANFAPKELEANIEQYGLEGGIVGGIILSALSENQDYSVSEKTLRDIEKIVDKQYLDNHCREDKCDLGVKVLVDQLLNHKKEEFEYLVKLVKKEGIKESIKQDIVKKIAKSTYYLNKEKIELVEDLIEDKSISENIEIMILKSLNKLLKERSELSYVNDKINKLIRTGVILNDNVVDNIFSYYKEEQKYFEEAIIEIIAEYKQISQESLENVALILPKLKEWNSVFIGFRVVQHGISIPVEVIKHFITHLESEKSEVRKTAVDFYHELGREIPEEVREEVIDGLIRSEMAVEELKKTKGQASGKIGEILVKFQDEITPVQNEVYDLQREAAKWEKSKEVDKKVDIARNLISKVNKNTVDILVRFAGKVLNTQEIELLKIGLELKDAISKHKEIEWSEREKKLLEIAKEANKEESELANSTKIVKYEKFIITEKQHTNLEKSIKSFSWEIGKYLGKIVFNEYREIVQLLEFLNNYGLSKDRFINIAESGVGLERVYEDIINDLILEKASRADLSISDKNIIKRSVTILRERGYDEIILYKLVREVNVSIMHRLMSYGVKLEDVDRHGNTIKTLLDKGGGEILEGTNKIIRDNRYNAPKQKKAILEEATSLNWEINEGVTSLLKKGYYDEQIGKWEQLRKECSIGIEEYEACPLKKKMDSWNKSDYQEWVNGLKGITDKNISEALFVISEAAKRYLPINGYPRIVQIVGILSLYKSEGGGLAQIETGEGKSLIIGMFSIIKMLENVNYRRQIDIITSSRELAKRDAEEYKEFYGIFGISVAHNIKESGAINNDCYKADILYGDTMNFIGDTLRDISINKKLGRGFDLIILDEVDNLFIDQSNMKTQLTSSMVGMEVLGQVIVNLWGNSIQFANNTLQRGDECFYRLEDINEEEKVHLEELGIDIGEGKLGEIKIGNRCDEILRSRLAEYIEENILAYNQDNRTTRAIIVPRHIEEFAKDQIHNWIRSLFQSVSYEESKEYVVTRDTGEGGHEFRLAAPIDSEKTGIIQFRLQLSDGLQQFLQLKHKLTMTVENVITTFMSYYGYFSKYRGNIYGVSGTIGDEVDQEYLKKVYEVNLMKIPSFIKKDLVKYEPLAVEGNSKWKREILESVEREALGKRAVLIIIEKIKDVKEIEEILGEGYKKEEIYVYAKGGKEEEKIVRRELQAGDVIVASNLAGRGTDLRLSSEVMKNGGLHVIVGTFPNHIRVQDQAYGRAARQGQPGTAEIIVDSDATGIHNTYIGCRDNIECLLEARKTYEYVSLTEDRVCRLPMLELRDKIFGEFVKSLSRISSPTKYNIIIGDGEDGKEKTIYVYIKDKKVYIKAVKKIDGELKEKEFNENYLSIIDPQATRHIKTILANSKSKESSLNKQDLELINFVAANSGYSDIDIIIKKVDYKFNKEVERASGKCVEGYQNKMFYRAEDIYLQCLQKEDENYMDIESPNLVEKVKLRKRFELWIKDRSDYNTDSEVKQVTEYFGLWLKRNNDYFEVDCDIEVSDKQGEELSKKLIYSSEEIEWKIKYNKEKVEENFKEFIKELGDKEEQKRIFENSNLLVIKAWHLMRLETQEREVRDHFMSQGWFGSAQNIIRGVFNWGISVLIGMNEDEIYMPQSPVSNAIEVLEKASELEPHYSWTTYNALGYAKLIKEGKGLKQLTEKNAQKAYNIKKEFAKNTDKAIEQIVNGVIPIYESQLAYLGSMRMLNYEDDLAIQLIGSIKIYEQIIERLQKNIEFISKLNGKEMIRMGRNIPLEEATENALNYTIGNVTDIVNNQLKNKFVLVKSIESNTRNIKFESYQYIVDQIKVSGGFLFTLESYELEEKKNWWGTVFAAAIGILSIVSGLAVINAWGLTTATTAAGATVVTGGSVFGTAFGASLIFQGIGDILGSIISVATNNPIDFEGFIKSKGMALGVSLATAGTLQFLSGIEAINNIAGITSKFAGLAEKAKDVAGFITGAAVLQTAVTGASAVIYNGLKNAVDPEEIRKKVEEAVKDLLESGKISLKKIFATDEYVERKGYQQKRHYLTNKLHDAINEIVSNYHGRFHGDKEEFAMGYGMDVLSNIVVGPIASMTGIISSTGKAIQGAIKSKEAVEIIISNIRKKVENIGSEGLTPGQMMVMQLEGGVSGIGKEDGDYILDALKMHKHVSETNIVSECDGNNGVGSVAIGEYSKYRERLVASCKDIKSFIDQEFTQEFNEFRNKLVGDITTTKTHIQKHELVKPIANGLGGVLGKGIADSKFGKEIENKIAERFRNKDEAAQNPIGNALKESKKAEEKQLKTIIINRELGDKGTKPLPKPSKKPNGKEIPVEDGDNLWKLWEKKGKPLGISWSKFKKDNVHIEQKYGTLNEMHKGDIVYADTTGIGTKQQPANNNVNKAPAPVPTDKTKGNVRTGADTGDSTTLDVQGTCPAGDATCDNPTVLQASYTTTQATDPILKNNENGFIEIFIKESKRYFEIKNKEFISNPEDSGPFDLLKTIVGYELHMAGVAVDKLGDEFPNAAKLGNNILELINMPFNWAGEKAAEGYKFTKKELIESIKNKYGEDAGYKTEYYINQAENKIAEKLAKFAPTDMQQKTLKFFEGIGAAKLATKPLIGTKKVLTKPDTPHHKTHTDSNGKIDLTIHEKLDGHSVLKHTDKTDNALIKSLNDKIASVPKGAPVKPSSSFTNLEIANESVNKLINARSKDIDKWLSDPLSKRAQEFDLDMNKVVGRGIGIGDTTPSNWNKARVVLFKENENKYRIITSYPIKKLEN